MRLHLILAVLLVAPVAAQPTPSALPVAVAELERIDALRSGLAGTFAMTGAPADQAAFARVCQPVGMAMQQAAAANGWQAGQVAVRFRNPANRADAEAERVLQQMARDASLQAVTLRTSKEGKAGARYLRRITVESSCLLCHGARETRPEFITRQYPDDRAYGFAVGDLRGAYSVFMPDPR